MVGQSKGILYVSVAMKGLEECVYRYLEIQFSLVTYNLSFSFLRMKLYYFEDRGNHRVPLRPELTLSLARLVIQKG